MRGTVDHAAVVVDPVCGMTVDPSAAVSFEHAGEKRYFCCEGCHDAFAASPDRYVRAAAAPPAQGGHHSATHRGPAPDRAHRTDARGEARTGPSARSTASSAWTCPMHPEIRRDSPDACPICGMALESLTPTAEEGDNDELDDMTRRFWIGVALTAPLLLAMLAEHVPGDRSDARARSRSRRVGAARARDSGRALVRLAVLRPRLAVDRQPQPQHVHADRARYRLGVASIRYSRPCFRARCRPLSAAPAERRRCISRPRP